MFFDARRKIDRADKHIDDVEREVLALERHYVSAIETDKQTGGQSIKYECPGLQDRLTDIALITGDAVHNLRAALDYAWVGVIDALKLPPTRWTKFPFADRPETLNKALLQRNINGASPTLFKKIMTDIQPYRGGDAFLWSLHHADITDKHKLVLPLIDYTGATDIRVEDEHGVIYPVNVAPRRGSQGIIFFDFPPNFNIKNKGNISVSIFFHEGSVLAGVPILEELYGLSSSAMKVVSSLESLV
jgi:hypothetical protein